MKFQRLLSILALSAFALFSACKNDSSASKEVPLASEDAILENNTAAPAANPATPEPPQNATGVWHYTCPKGCTGGSGSAIPCATCGTTLTHNQVYHGSAAPTAISDPTKAPSQAPPGIPPAGKQPEPPQNAAGVWHFTCASGCEGGAGAEAPCAKCGKPLLHNKTYHN